MIALNSSYLSICISPTDGAMITSLRSKKTKDEWLFFDPSKRPDGSILECYDDVWCGGFEELFPNDSAGIVDGRVLKDHGELWRRKWDVFEINEREIILHIRCDTVPAEITKHIVLSKTSPIISILYTIKNTTDKSFPYLFKLHPAMRIEPEDELLLSGGNIIPVDPSFSKIIGSDGPFQWPYITDIHQQKKNLAIIPERNKNLQEFIYVIDMNDGWCGLQRKRTGEKLIISYPIDFFPYCWFFMALGGWRNYYTVVVEPCTNYPKDINTAIINQSCAFLKPREQRHFTISLRLI